MNWDLFEHFRPEEFACKCGDCDGEVKMDEEFMFKLRSLRKIFNRPMIISSGYRCPLHPLQSKEHGAGKAADILISGTDARDLVSLAWEFPRIGIKQHGEGRFIHLGTMTADEIEFSPWIWTYD